AAATPAEAQECPRSCPRSERDAAGCCSTPEELLIARCDAAHPGRCVAAGLAFERGAGVGADPVRAAELYRRACATGEREGCRRLGALTRTGVGVPRDADQALVLFRTACDQGDGEACYQYAEMHERAEGTPLDTTHARD